MRELVARVRGFFGQRVTLHDKPLAAPEPAFVRGKPMTSYFESLTAEQQRRVLTEPDKHNHGDPSFPREKRNRAQGKPAHA